MANAGTDPGPPWVRWLLWIDGGGGLVAGALVLGLHGLVASWYGLPERIVLFTGAANVAYGLFALQLAVRQVRPKGMIRGLVVANGIWPAACLGLLVEHGAGATWLGRGHLTLEGLYVGALAFVEWRARDGLRFRRQSSSSATNSGGS